MNKQDKILVLLLAMNFLVIGVYSTAIPIPLENQNIYLSLYDNNDTPTTTNDTLTGDNLNTDQSTDSSQTTNTQQNAVKPSSGNQNNNNNPVTPDPVDPEPPSSNGTNGGHKT